MKAPATPLGVTLEALARLVGGEVRGTCEELIIGITGIREAGKGQITFLANPKYGKDLETTQASAVIVGRQFPETKKPLIVTPNPYLAYARIAQFFASQTGTSEASSPWPLWARIAESGKTSPFIPLSIWEIG